MLRLGSSCSLLVALACGGAGSDTPLPAAATPAAAPPSGQTSPEAAPPNVAPQDPPPVPGGFVRRAPMPSTPEFWAEQAAIDTTPVTPAGPLPPPPDPCASLEAWSERIGHVGTLETVFEEPCAPGEDMCGQKGFQVALADGGNAGWTEGAGSSEWLVLPGRTLAEVWPGVAACVRLEADLTGWPLPTTSEARPYLEDGDGSLSIEITVRQNEIVVTTGWGASCSLRVTQGATSVLVYSECDH